MRVFRHSRNQVRWLYGVALFFSLVGGGAAIISIESGRPSFAAWLWLIAPVVPLLIVNGVMEIHLRQKLAHMIYSKPRRAIFGSRSVTTYHYDRAVEMMLTQLAERLGAAIRVEEAMREGEYCPATMGVIRAHVRLAKSAFWRAYWLASIFDKPVKSSWKDYLTAQVA